MIPVLQSRWRLEGQYLMDYGLRQPPHMLRRKLWLDRRTAALVASLDGLRTARDYALTPAFVRLVRQGIVVDAACRRTPPRRLEEAVTVKTAPPTTT